MSGAKARQALLLGAFASLAACEHASPEPLLTLAGEELGHSSAFLRFPESASNIDEIPEKLSETGAFEDVASLATAQGLMPYGVQNQLWSDGAHKRRWLSLPADTHIGFSARGQWTFPEGTVFVKHFSMALDERHPEELRHLETRFWIAARDGQFYGAVYKWNDDQLDAELISEGRDEALTIVDSDGTPRQQTYSYPASSSCQNCHSAARGPVRGVRTSQLNGDFDYGEARGQPGTRANQLETWNGLDWFEDSIGDPAQYPSLAPLTDESRPAEARVRSYWDSNCSMCHDGGASSSWDARFEVPLAEQGVLMAEPRSGAGPEDLRLIYPGQPERSWLYRRVSSEAPGVRMPPILRNRVDEVYVELLESWIRSLPE